jgi:hypothetical protein
MPTINPFGGTSTASGTPDLAPIKLFGCTVIDFNVSADWSSQGGSLNCRLIESDTDGDRLKIPVLGSPVLFELKDNAGNVLFQYIGIVDSFSRSAGDGKTYSANLSSPMLILDATSVIMNGYAGLGSSREGSYLLNGMTDQQFGHNNSGIIVDNSPGVYHWWNVANLINVFGILENDDPQYRVPTNIDANLFGVGTRYGDFGFSSNSQDGIPLIKLMWALHMGINHLPQITETQKQKTHGGNLLFGRHNYNLYDDQEAIPYYYHFDAIHFYNQIVGKLGPEYRVAGDAKTLSEIISHLCTEANLEFFTYLDIYTDQTIGDPTLQDEDPYINRPAVFNWSAGVGQSMIPIKFPLGGNYGGTIRVQTIDKNSFFNSYRPFSNIAYNLIGLEVPDLKSDIFASNSVHPGKRPIGDSSYGLASSNSTIYSDPLDSSGVRQWRGSEVQSQEPTWGFTDVSTKSLANGGSFPVQQTGVGGLPVLFDPSKLSDVKIKNSDISIKLNDLTTMKVVTGGYQTRLVTASGSFLRHYWGDIIVTGVSDPKSTMDTATDQFGLDETSTRKIPVITPILDPRDVDDYILIDMKSEFGPITVSGVLYQGIYAASMLEIRCAMASIESWKGFIDGYKQKKVDNLINAFYPLLPSGSGQNGISRTDQLQSTNYINGKGGLGYAGIVNLLGLGNVFTAYKTPNELISVNCDKSGEFNNLPTASGDGIFGLGLNMSRAQAEFQVKGLILPKIHEKLKELGDTHYGKSWYAPVPYAKAMQDLDGDSLVGDFKRAWELNDSAYVEPSNYYPREIPQSNLFIKDGKVTPFLNYNQDFLTSNTGQYDTTYAKDITNLLGQKQMICNFSEYDLDRLCMTRYSPSYVDASGNILFNTSGVSGITIVHAAPDSIEDIYAFLPVGYDYYYNRASLPYSDILTGLSKKYTQKTMPGIDLIPSGEGQQDTIYYKTVDTSKGYVASANNLTLQALSTATTGSPEYNYSGIIGIPSQTQNDWLVRAVSGLQALEYPENGRFCFPFVKFSTARVFLPVPRPGFVASNGLGDIPLNGLNAFLGTSIRNKNGFPNQPGDLLPSGRARQLSMMEDQIVSVLQPFQTCVVPRSFNYTQLSTRYVYGPWITSLEYIPFRGKVEYEQDESLVPENFLIPNNFGQFGSYTLSQISGFAGMNLAAQGKANAIDDFALFALEEGSITIPGAPSIKRVGDSLYGIQQVTDIKISVNNNAIETTYSFKTISPKFGKNTRDLEQKMTKISNDIKKLKLR